MNASDFEELSEQTKMIPRTKEAARMVLVEGLKVTVVASALGMHRQQVQQAVNRVTSLLREREKIPRHWVCITVCTPPDTTRTIRALAARARAKYLAGGD